MNTTSILFLDNGMAASCLKVKQMALVNNVCSILPSNFLSKSDPGAISRILSETRSTERMNSQLHTLLLC